ncbi:MAG: hypothetical protein FLDDKLPJ_02571 [Phycisphaerae bacterium]|nr:hypothetical protein [Phycisphaerae bacterium]
MHELRLRSSTRTAVDSTIAATLAWLLAVSTAPALAQCDPAKYVGEESVAGEWFGRSVALDGRRALVGAPRHGDGLPGAAYTFTFDGFDWHQEQRLLVEEGRYGGEFGYAVGLHGTTAVVGAAWRDEPVDREGAAFVYRFDGATWNLQAKLVAPDADPVDLFGYAVAVHGDVIVVGARGDDENGTDAGAAYVFRRDGSTWAFEQKLIGAEGGEPMFSAFGFCVDVHDQRIIVGAPWDDRSDSDDGAAYVYRFDNTEWELEAALLPPRFSLHVGFAVAIDGDTAMVGASDHGPSGEVLEYRFSSGRWTAAGAIRPPQQIGRANFGYAIGLDADRLVVGAYSAFDHTGVAYLFERSPGGDWEATWRFDPFKVNDTLGAPPYFGDACAISGEFVVIGAPHEDSHRGGDSGMTYAFRPGCGEGCAGSERIRKARCNDRSEVLVKVVGGLPGDAFRVQLSSGELLQRILNRRGKGKAVFNDVKRGNGVAEVTWGCGSRAEQAYFCP